MRTIIVLDRIRTKNDLDKLCDNQKVLELKGVLKSKSLLTIGSPVIVRFWHGFCIIYSKFYTRFSQAINKVQTKLS